MHRRFVISLLAALIAVQTPALADHDQGRGKSGHGQPGLNQQDDDDDGAGGADVDDDDEDNSQSVSASDQDDALDAVARGRAMSLEELIARIDGTIDGEIIDARLIRVNGVLLYEIKVLSPYSQTVSRYYYNARSGQRVSAD